MRAPYLTWGETKGTWDTDVALQTDVVLHQSDLSKVRDAEGREQWLYCPLGLLQSSGKPNCLCIEEAHLDIHG